MAYTVRLFARAPRQSRFTELVASRIAVEITAADRMVIIIFGFPFG